VCVRVLYVFHHSFFLFSCVCMRAMYVYVCLCVSCECVLVS